MKTNDELEPTAFIISGGTGDWTWQKLVPALFELSQNGGTPGQYSVIAVHRPGWDDEKLRRRSRDGVKKFDRPVTPGDSAPGFDRRFQVRHRWITPGNPPTGAR